jgi:diguanylate cyclase (GGDEF)-like protein
MSILPVSSATLRVAIADYGIDGAADEVRDVLAAAQLLELLPIAAPPDPDAESAAAARSVIPSPDVVVLTWGAACELGAALTATRRAAPDAAIVVVAPWFDEALFLKAIRLGAEDCIPAAQIDTPGILRALLLAAERHRMTSSLRVAAFTDELTGLYNRRGYVTRAAALLKVADPKTVWQIFFDVDELKIINDTYGHWAGDRALMELAAVLRQAFRSSDIVARVGGDEFAVLAVAPADAAPDSWAARWREPLTALAGRRDLPLTVSVGLAQPDEHGQMTPEDLLTRADITMYTAKRLRKKLADGGTRSATTLPISKQA